MNAILIATIAVIYGAVLATVIRGLADAHRRRPAPVAVEAPTAPITLPAGLDLTADLDRVLDLFAIVETPDGPRVRQRA